MAPYCNNRIRTFPLENIATKAVEGTFQNSTALMATRKAKNRI